MPRFTTLKSMSSAWTGVQRRFEASRPTPCSFSWADRSAQWLEMIEPVVKLNYVPTRKLLTSVVDNTSWNAQRDVHFGEFADAAFGAQATDVRVSTISEVVKPPSKYKDFQRRKAEGEIVLNPLKKVSSVCQMYTGALKANTTLYQTRYIDHLHPELFLRWPTMATCPTYGVGRNYGDYLVIGDNNSRFTYDVWNTASLAHPMSQAKLQSLHRQVIDELALIEVDTGLVTATRAESNEKILDLTTSLAEAPETIRSIMDLVKTILIKYLECKREIKVLKKNVIGGKPPIDLIAEVWLRFRYEVYPNIYAIEDALTYLDAEVLQYMTTRVGERIEWQPPAFEDWEASPILVHHRAYIKNRFDAAMSKARQGLGFHLGTTFWETVPLSFIWDWVFNIGELIASIGTPSGSVQEGAMYSTKVNTTVVYKNPNWVGPPIQIQLEVYDGKPILPGNHLGFNIQLDLNWKRKLDATSLLWLAFKGEFQQVLRKLK